MIESRLVSKKAELEFELKLGVRDPKRRAYLTQRLLGVERDIAALGLQEDEIRSNDVAVGHKQKQTNQNSFLVPPPDWYGTEYNKDQPKTNQDQGGHRERMLAYKAEADARTAAWEKAGKKLNDKHSQANWQHDLS
jgi:hypothetical protein